MWRQECCGSVTRHRRPPMVADGAGLAGWVMGICGCVPLVGIVGRTQHLLNAWRGCRHERLFRPHHELVEDV